ncbi:MAG: ATP-binding protein [Bacteroidales bacterium]|jgi:adenylate kinase|nr:ATP-binding protein [Bacteroidales bacterium]
MSNQRDITLFVGLSGVGKTFVINRLLSEERMCIHLSAGSLIKKKLTNIERDSLRVLNKEVILKNQFLMAEQFNCDLVDIDKDCRIFLDAHMLVDNDEELIDIPFSIFKMISPSRLIFLFDEVETIVARRQRDVTRTRPERSSEELAKQQDRSFLLAQSLCDYLSIPFYAFLPSEIDEMKEAISLH